MLRKRETTKQESLNPARAAGAIPDEEGKSYTFHLIYSLGQGIVVFAQLMHSQHSTNSKGTSKGRDGNYGNRE